MHVLSLPLQTWLCALLLCLASGCVADGDSSPVMMYDLDSPEYVVADELFQQAAPTGGEVSPLVAPVDGEYRLGPADVFQLDVWDNPELSGEYIVGPDGAFTLPLYGVVKVGERTRAEAAALIAEMLRGEYTDPQVGLLLRAYNNNNVFVLGQVTSPGVYKLEGQPRLLQVLSRAGGVLNTADQTDILITRGNEMIIRINLYELLRQGNLALNIQLLPNDIVYVPDSEQRVVTVIGQVHAPAMIPVHERLDLLTALTYAGSTTENAVTSEVRVVRPLDGGRVRVITVDVERIYTDGALSANIQLQPGDTVYVPERGISQFNYVLRQISPGLSTYLVFDSVDKALNE